MPVVAARLLPRQDPAAAHSPVGGNRDNGAMRLRRGRWGGLLAVAGCALSAGCAGQPAAGPPPVVVTDSPSPRPTITTTLAVRTLAAGTSTDFTAQAGVSLRLTASTPRVSTTRLSRSYGHP